MVGKDIYSLLRNLVSPAKPNARTYDEITGTLAVHLKPKKIVIAERFKFYDRKQDSTESVNEFVAVIRKLASTCVFGVFF